MTFQDIKNLFFKFGSKEVVLLIWTILAILYFSHTLPGEHNHDYGGHLEYSHIIASKKALPKPHDGWQTYHPPLYYLINNFLAPSIIKNKANHIDYVRIFSLIYGFITIWIMGWFLEKLNIPPFHRFLSLLYICTVPKFMMIFSTYNNDSFVTMLLVASTVLSYRLYLEWNKNLAILLLLVSTAALYTKYSAVICMGVLILICGKDLIKLRLPGYAERKVLAVLFSSLILFSPWVYFHNYKETHKLFPNNTEHGLGSDLAIDDDRPVIDTIIRLPFSLSRGSHEWDDPWAHGYSRPESKKHNYWAFCFITSLFSENVYEKPGVNLVWLMFWLNLVIVLLGLSRIKKTSLTKLAALFIGLAHLAHITLLLSMEHPAACTMDYRYLSWSWIAWAVLYSDLLSEKSELSRVFSKLLIVAVILHSYTLIVLFGNGT